LLCHLRTPRPSRLPRAACRRRRRRRGSRPGPSLALAPGGRPGGRRREATASALAAQPARPSLAAHRPSHTRARSCRPSRTRARSCRGRWRLRAAGPGRCPHCVALLAGAPACAGVGPGRTELQAHGRGCPWVASAGAGSRLRARRRAACDQRVDVQRVFLACPTSAQSAALQVLLQLCDPLLTEMHDALLLRHSPGLHYCSGVVHSWVQSSRQAPPATWLLAYKPSQVYFSDLVC